MAESKTYTGGCHCGAVRFEVTAALTEPLATCNCSMCGRTGAIMTFVGADQFKLLSGEDAQQDYQFSKKRIHHLFCRTCGVRSFSRGKGQDGRDMISINIRCLDGIDPTSFKTTQYDGKSL